MMFYHVLNLLLDRNECDNFPCQNGGMCINNDGSFTCVCKDGWEGAECQNGMAFPYITQVTNYVHCLTCISIENTILQIPIFTDTNECLTFPCQNNGTCINNPGSYKCDCNNGWTGKDCIEGTSKHVLFCQEFGYTINIHAFNVHVYTLFSMY